MSQLSDRCRLAGAVDADDENDAGAAAVEAEPPRFTEHRRDLVDERLAQIADFSPGLEPPNELGRRRDADVGRDQRLLEAFPGRVVGRIERGGRKLFRERPAALAE